jgi:hypothetical protein
MQRTGHSALRVDDRSRHRGKRQEMSQQLKHPNSLYHERLAQFEF